MTSIQYLRGDVTKPQGDGNIIIVHICNNVGRFDAGVAAAIARRWPEAKMAYLRWSDNSSGDFRLGEVQFVTTAGFAMEGEKLVIANMLAQEGLREQDKRIPLRYDALESCLWKVCEEAKRLNASVHMPRIGTGRAGGYWSRIESIVVHNLCWHDVSVFVYDFSQL